MSVIAGRVSRVEIDNGGGFVLIGCLTDASLEVSVDEIDVSCKDSGGPGDGQRDFIPGFSDASLTFTVIWDDADAGQEDLKAAILAKTTVGWKFLAESLVGADEFEATGFGTALTIDSPRDAEVSAPITVRLKADLTRTAQT